MIKGILVGFILYILFVAALGIYCTEYFIWAMTGQDISIVGDSIIALFFGSLTVPAAILLKLFDIFGGTLPL